MPAHRVKPADHNRVIAGHLFEGERSEIDWTFNITHIRTLYVMAMTTNFVQVGGTTLYPSLVVLSASGVRDATSVWGAFVVLST